MNDDFDLLREATEVPADAVRELRLRVLAGVDARRRRQRWLWFGIPSLATALLVFVFLAAPRTREPERRFTRVERTAAMELPVPPVAKVAAPVAARKSGAVRKAKPQPPVVMQIETADPDVVIYLVSQGAEE